ncbi:hypothetical protein O9992_14950 [Vibrio lentus]|nr:hypothetical protein [Vibrio lentus]
MKLISEMEVDEPRARNVDIEVADIHVGRGPNMQEKRWRSYIPKSVLVFALKRSSDKATSNLYYHKPQIEVGDGSRIAGSRVVCRTNSH